jgi:hypothetical protein
MKGMRTAAVVAAVVLSTSLCKTSAAEAPILQDNKPSQLLAEQPMPVDAFGYLGGLLEARFYEPHATTDEPREEIRQAALLYGIDLPMMLSIAKVESDFNPRVRTGSYKGLFQLSYTEFEKYGDGSIWDARDNARAAAHMFLVQAEKFKSALGHFPDYAERYMVHQQGIEGAIEHYEHPERVAWQSMCATSEGLLKGEHWCKRCIWGNLLPQWKRFFGSVETISSRDFVNVWTGRINLLADRYAAADDQSVTNSTGGITNSFSSPNSLGPTNSPSSINSPSSKNSRSIIHSRSFINPKRARSRLPIIARRTIAPVHRAAERPSHAASALADVGRLVSRAFAPAKSAATRAKASPSIATAVAERRRGGAVGLRRPLRQASAVVR